MPDVKLHIVRNRRANGFEFADFRGERRQALRGEWHRTVLEARIDAEFVDEVLSLLPSYNKALESALNRFGWTVPSWLRVLLGASGRWSLRFGVFDD